MWSSRLFFAVGLAAALALAGCAAEPPMPRLAQRSAQAIAAVRLDPAAVASALNAYRASKGLKPVRLEPALIAMAERQAQAMAAGAQVSHDVAGAFPARLAASGVDAAAAGENLGAGYMSFEEALAGWRASPGHDANLLMAEATRFGVALAKNPDASYGTFWAMEMAAEPPAAAAKAGAPFLPLSGSAALPR